MLAAYAFVLNALLATTLLAATPPAKSLSGFEICAASSDSTADIDHADKATKRAAVHCQLCLQSTAPAAIIPDPPRVAFVLNATGAAPLAALGPGVRAARPEPSRLPRGPPA